ncbi:MAG: hypothetical protein HY232_07100 [Acidobacteria bacterium]|nr:hypothetical protein [Acidobacteriota bacterium]
MGSELQAGLDWAETTEIATGFVTVPALKYLKTALAKAKSQKAKYEILVVFGLYPRFTPQ